MNKGFGETVYAEGNYRPFSGTWRTDAPEPELLWTARIPLFSSQQLEKAVVSSDPVFTQLPTTVTPRVRQLAEEITQGHRTPHQKAKAIEKYLRTTYTYAFSGPDDDSPSDVEDPVDWFLFAARKGTCGQLQRLRRFGAVRGDTRTGGVWLGSGERRGAPDGFFRPSPPVGRGPICRPGLDYVRPYRFGRRAFQGRLRIRFREWAVGE